VFAKVILTDGTDKIFSPGYHLLRVFQYLCIYLENSKNRTYCCG